MDGHKTLAFSGHRPRYFDYSLENMSFKYAMLETRIADEIEKLIVDGYARFICGCAMGADIIFGETVLNARQRLYSEIELVCAMPFPGQANS
ncbi:MAG: SLOG family protein [Clostridia bacterium]|nr:SLOG family protein [Clostridia bacterium]